VPTMQAVRLSRRVSVRRGNGMPAVGAASTLICFACQSWLDLGLISAVARVLLPNDECVRQ
jgi:hypothetical protein